MSKLKTIFQTTALILIISILFTACDVPDISKFTETSAEMTRGIRKGVKETGSILEINAASEFVSETAQTNITNSSENYNKTLKPTLKALDALDAYLEALSALAAANKKSEENAKNLIDAIGNLATTVSGLTIPDTAVNVGTALVSVAEQIRTAKDFKKRVTLVELLVNGGSSDSSQPCNQGEFPKTDLKLRNSLEKLFPDIKTERERLEKEITEKLKSQTTIKFENINGEVATLTKEVNELNEKINNENDQTRRAELERERKTKSNRISDLQDAKKSIQKVYNSKIVSLDEKQREAWLTEAGTDFCGIIDILKLNMEELNKIQTSGLMLLYNNTKQDNQIITDYHDEIVRNDQNVQAEIALILSYKNNLKTLKEFIVIQENPQKIESLKLRIQNTLKGIYAMDSTLKALITSSIAKSDEECERNSSCPNTEVDKESRHERITTKHLEEREEELMLENERLLADLKRIEPHYIKVVDELNRIRTKRKEMKQLFESSIEGLDVWGQTHSNLRVSLNTKKPLTVSRLISKTTEIWEILKPMVTAE